MKIAVYVKAVQAWFELRPLHDYGEERFVTFGILDGRVVAVVHTETEDLIRIISIRKATKYEEKAYFSKIPD
jgi:uncharacterized DUF497 family protein